MTIENYTDPVAFADMKQYVSREDLVTEIHELRGLLRRTFAVSSGTTLPWSGPSPDFFCDTPNRINAWLRFLDPKTLEIREDSPTVFFERVMEDLAGHFHEIDLPSSMFHQNVHSHVNNLLRSLEALTCCGLTVRVTCEPMPDRPLAMGVYNSVVSINPSTRFLRYLYSFQEELANKPAEVTEVENAPVE